MGSDKTFLDNYIDDLEEEIVDIRRDFHKYAESGWTEFRTASKIANYLSKLGYEVKLGEEIFKKEDMMGLPSEEELKLNIKRALSQGGAEKYISMMREGYTGVVAVLDTGIPGKVTAFRFDIDANDGLESSSSEHRPFREGFSSVNKDSMHACGHDGHAAIGLGLAKVLKEFQKELRGKIILIFQPAEEGTRGAKSMANSNILDNVDYFLSGHIGLMSNKFGEIACGTEGFLSTTKMDIIFRGRGSHAGVSPQKGKNALLGAATAALNLHTLCQHEEGVGRINVGVLNSGKGRNIIPDYAIMKIETRGETNNINEYITQRAKEVIKASALMHDLEWEIKIVGGAESSNSDEELSEVFKEEVKNIKGIESIVDRVKLTGSEDVTYMMNKVQEKGGKAVYVIFGTKIAADHHNNSFDFDEGVLKIAIKAYAHTAIKLNGKEDGDN
ncbi:amidohydrolase [Clostridium sp. MSJ-11]|uniref:Amidohydrolase n=1 Tax=Clostridium mobile TaxID=2841512 RepID=A0ABS6EJI2_9CLOT|nr:amidohydrolase [Clostridium mobile]MBU5485361.1 amidohydrolase [Clostridium mobile]